MALYRIDFPTPTSVVLFVDAAVTSFTVHKLDKRELEDAKESEAKRKVTEDKIKMLHPIMMDDRSVDVDAGDDKPSDNDSDDLTNDSDDDSFDEEAYNDDGVELLEKLCRFHAGRITTEFDSFIAFFEYVVRCVQSKRWQNKANKNADDPELAHMFSENANMAWDTYAILCNGLTESCAWKTKPPGSDKDFLTILQDHPHMSQSDLRHAHHGRCDACGRQRTISVAVHLSGQPYDSKYQDNTGALHDLYEEQRRAVVGNVSTWKVGRECAARIKLYHGLYHFLWHMVHRVGNWFLVHKGVSLDPAIPESLKEIGMEEFIRSSNLTRPGRIEYTVNEVVID